MFEAAKLMAAMTVSGIVMPLGSVPPADKAKLQGNILAIRVFSTSEDGETSPVYVNTKPNADDSFRASGLPPGKLHEAARQARVSR